LTYDPRNIPGMGRSRSGVARMKNYDPALFAPQWRDPPGQYAEDFFEYVIQLPTPFNAGASTQVTLNIEADSAFEWIYTTAQGLVGTTGQSLGSSLGITCLISDGASSRNLMNMPLPLDTIAGAGATSATGNSQGGSLPYVLPVPRRFMAKSSIIFTFFNFTSATNYSNVQLVLHGRKIFSKTDPAILGNVNRFRSYMVVDEETGAERWFSEDLFFYGFTWPGAPALAASMATPLASTQLMEADSDFEWVSSNGIVATSADAAFQRTPLIQLTVKDGATSRYLSGGPIQNNNLGGEIMWMGLTGAEGLPYVLPTSRIFKAKTPVSVFARNVDTVNTFFNPYYVMQGRKIFELN
jgi:hypothetical protein